MKIVKSISSVLANHFKHRMEQCPKIEEEKENMANVPYLSAEELLCVLWYVQD